MRNPLLLCAVLLVGCASSGTKLVGVDRVPEKRPAGAEYEVYLSAAQVKALGRIYEDAQQYLKVHGEGAVCQFTTGAIGVGIYAADSTGARYVVVGYNPEELCPPLNVPVPTVHRWLSYVLTADGQVLGPRIGGR